MSFIKVILEAEATGEVKAAYEKTLAGPRQAGLADKDILLIAAAIAYHNYSIRMAAAFDVRPR